jgi:uncharacterized protein (DUF885 family)
MELHGAAWMRAITVTAVCLSLLAACAREPEVSTATATNSAAPAAKTAKDWPLFVDEFIQARMAANPFDAIAQGLHEFDGKAPDWSRAGLDADVAALKAVRAEVERFDPVALSAEQRMERANVEAVIDTALFWQETAAAPFKNPAWYLQQLDPQVYLTREYASLDVRMRGYVGYARSIPHLAEHIRANLQTPLPKTYIERAIGGFGGFVEFYRKDVPSVFAAVEDGELQKEFAEANEAAAKAMAGLVAWLESERPKANDDFMLGAPLYLTMLRKTSLVDTPLDELLRVGREDLERNLGALKGACDKFAPKASLKACVDRMRATKPEGGSVEGARKQLEELRAFVRDRKIATLPTEEQALVGESPPYNRGNFAYIQVPGPYEKDTVKSTYYVAPPDPTWSPAQRNAYLPGRAYLLFVSAHEVWPGHYLQGMFTLRQPSKVASVWWDYASGEGWAHYAEEMMWDQGLGNGDPEMQVGMLSNALLRNVRYLCSIGMHTGGLSVDECERMFRDQAFADPGNARQQAVRGTYDPGYLAYTLGKLMIRKLWKDWKTAHADGTLQQFHDQFLSYGAPPIPLVRREMLGELGAVL